MKALSVAHSVTHCGHKLALLYSGASVKLETPIVLSPKQSESPMCAAFGECGRRAAAPINSSTGVPVSAGEVFLAKRDETVV